MTMVGAAQTPEHQNKRYRGRMNQTIVCAHRGLEDGAPENTLASFVGAPTRGCTRC